MKIETLAVHGGYSPDPTTKAVAVPVYQTASYELQRRNGRYALCTMCIGVGQGIAMIIERV